MAVEIEPIAAGSKNSRHVTAPAPYSAACCCAGAGRQRKTGFRAASVSSSRRRGVQRGAARKAAASPAPVLLDWARSARPRNTEANWSSEALLSVSVGSISKAPCTTSGKYIVIG